MKRSEINKAIEKAKARLAEYRISLPMFAYWTPETWKAHQEEIGLIRKSMLGWDITDFGKGDFAHCGAVLFTVRNGDKDDKKLGRPYAEKYIIMEDGCEQEIPFHYHVEKTEDIINRGGGVLVLEMYHSTKDNKLDTEKPVELLMDGVIRTFKPGERIEVTPGNSVTITPYLFHRFFAKTGEGDLIVGEVSRVNDDCTDNVFYQPSDRFTGIEEDEAPIHPLVNEYGKL